MLIPHLQLKPTEIILDNYLAASLPKVPGPDWVSGLFNKKRDIYFVY